MPKNDGPKLRLLSNRVLVLPQVESETPGGIILPEDARDRPTRGRVLAVGPGFTDTKTGRLNPMTVAVGDEVLYNQFSGREVELDEGKFRILDESEVLAVL